MGKAGLIACHIIYVILILGAAAATLYCMIQNEQWNEDPCFYTSYQLHCPKQIMGDYTCCDNTQSCYNGVQNCSTFSYGLYDGLMYGAAVLEGIFCCFYIIGGIQMTRFDFLSKKGKKIVLAIYYIFFTIMLIIGIVFYVESYYPTLGVTFIIVGSESVGIALLSLLCYVKKRYRNKGGVQLVTGQLEVAAVFITVVS